MRNLWRKSRRRGIMGFASLISIVALQTALASPASASIGVCTSIYHISGSLSPYTKGTIEVSFTFGYSPTVVAGIYNNDGGHMVWPSYVKQNGNIAYVGFIYDNNVPSYTSYSGNTVIDYQC